MAPWRKPASRSFKQSPRDGQPEAIDNLPVGGINRARRAVYKVSADDRRRRNHVPLGEPFEAV